MALSGRKPKPPALKLVTGNPGHRPIEGTGDAAAPPVREAPLVPHRKLTKAQRALWDRFIETAWWLTDHDVPKAYAWVCLQAEYDKAPVKMVAARIAQLRVLGNELGFDPSERGRLGISSGQRKDAADEFFG